MLKRLKHIEDKADNQLRAIEGRKDKSVRSSQKSKSKTTTDLAGEIKFAHKKFEKLVKDVIKKNKESENKDLEYFVPKGDKYNVNIFKNLESFAKKNDEG